MNLNGNFGYSEYQPPNSNWTAYRETPVPTFYCQLSYYGEQIDPHYEAPPPEPYIPLEQHDALAHNRSFPQAPQPGPSDGFPNKRHTIKFKDGSSRNIRFNDAHINKPISKHPRKHWKQTQVLKPYRASPQEQQNETWKSGNGATFKITTHITEPQNTTSYNGTVVVDGSSVAFAYGDQLHFACKGVDACVNFLMNRRLNVLVVVPSDRLRRGASKDVRVLYNLKKAGMLRQNWYGGFGTANNLDCDFVLKIAAQYDGVIVSNNKYITQRWNRTLQFEFNEEKKILFPNLSLLNEYFKE